MIKIRATNPLKARFTLLPVCPPSMMHFVRMTKLNIHSLGRLPTGKFLLRLNSVIQYSSFCLNQNFIDCINHIGPKSESQDLRGVNVLESVCLNLFFRNFQFYLGIKYITPEVILFLHFYFWCSEKLYIF